MPDTPTPPSHTAHILRKELDPEMLSALEAAENAATYEVNAYLVARAQELNIPPSQEIALLSGVPRVVGAAIDSIVLQILRRKEGDDV